MSTRLLDCRPRADYETGHVPGAVLLDPETTLSTPTANPSVGGRHPLPDPYVLGAAFADAGIGPDPLVLAFDDGTVGRALLVAPPAPRPRGLRHRRHARLHRPARDRGAAGRPGALRATRAGRRHDRCQGDPRAPRRPVARSRRRALAGARWRGDTEPLDPVAGRIPGARNAFFELPLPDDAAEPPEVVAYCGSGVTACVVAQARPRQARGRQALPRLVQRVVREPVQPDRERRPVTTPYDIPSDPAKRRKAALTDDPDRAGARRC